MINKTARKVCWAWWNYGMRFVFSLVVWLLNDMSFKETLKDTKVE